VPLIGPSSLLLALMASGLNGQRFAFQGYLPAKETERTKALRDLESESRKHKQTQICLSKRRTATGRCSTAESCRLATPTTRLTVATDLTLPR
jgi:16S rRNA (cytidine1402-2'-O)-methyltransferase